MQQFVLMAPLYHSNRTRPRTMPAYLEYLYLPTSSHQLQWPPNQSSCSMLINIFYREQEWLGMSYINLTKQATILHILTATHIMSEKNWLKFVAEDLMIIQKWELMSTNLLKPFSAPNNEDSGLTFDYRTAIKIKRYIMMTLLLSLWQPLCFSGLILRLNA